MPFDLKGNWVPPNGQWLTPQDPKPVSPQNQNGNTTSIDNQQVQQPVPLVNNELPYTYAIISYPLVAISLILLAYVVGSKSNKKPITKLVWILILIASLFVSITILDYIKTTNDYGFLASIYSDHFSYIQQSNVSPENFLKIRNSWNEMRDLKVRMVVYMSLFFILTSTTFIRLRAVKKMNKDI